MGIEFVRLSRVQPGEHSGEARLSLLARRTRVKRRQNLRAVGASLSLPKLGTSLLGHGSIGSNTGKFILISFARTCLVFVIIIFNMGAEDMVDGDGWISDDSSFYGTYRVCINYGVLAAVSTCLDLRQYVQRRLFFRLLPKCSKDTLHLPGCIALQLPCLVSSTPVMITRKNDTSSTEIGYIPVNSHYSLADLSPR